MSADSAVRIPAHWLAPASLLLLASACTPWNPEFIVRNGGDAPPFAEAGALARSDLGQLAKGDAVAWIHPPVDSVERCDEAAVYWLVPGERPQKQKAKAEKKKGEKDKQKSQKVRGEKDKELKRTQKSEKQKGEKQKGEKDKGEKDKGEKTDKSRKQKSKAAKQKRADMYCAKLARRARDPGNKARQLSNQLGLKSGTDSRSVVFQLIVGNSGEADFQGGFHVYDALPDGLSGVQTERVMLRQMSPIARFVAYISFVNFLTFFLPDFSDQMLDEGAIGFRESRSDGRLNYEVANVSIPRDKWIVIEFSAQVTGSGGGS